MVPSCPSKRSLVLVAGRSCLVGVGLTALLLAETAGAHAAESVPTPTPVTKSSQAEFIQEVKGDLGQLFLVELRVTTPKRYPVGQPRTVTAELRPPPPNAALDRAVGVRAPNLTRAGGRQRAVLKAADTSAVEVTDLNTDDKLVVSGEELASWSWSVKAQEPGRHDLSLIVSVQRGATGGVLVADERSLTVVTPRTVTGTVKQVTGMLQGWGGLVAAVVALAPVLVLLKWLSGHLPRPQSGRAAVLSRDDARRRSGAGMPERREGKRSKRGARD